MATCRYFVDKFNIDDQIQPELIECYSNISVIKSLMDGSINLLNFIFTDLHGYQITPGLGVDKQRHCLLLLKAGIRVAPTHL